MIVPLILFLASLAASCAALTQPGLSDIILVSVPCAFASLLLLLRALRGGSGRGKSAAKKWIVVDGSNVMYWRDNTPSIDTVVEVVQDLVESGHTPGVVFDANAGYLISDRFMNDLAFAKLLNLPRDRVMIAPKGTPADPLVLAAARDLGARVVSNDQFRDWKEDHPEIAEPRYLIKGGYSAGELWLNLGPVETAA